MEDKFLNLEVVTPEAIKYDGKISLLIVPGALGRLGILPGHASLVTVTEKGNIMIRLPDSREIYMKTGEGLLEVHSNKITLLVDSARETDVEDLHHSEVADIANLADNLNNQV